MTSDSTRMIFAKIAFGRYFLAAGIATILFGTYVIAQGPPPLAKDPKVMTLRSETSIRDLATFEHFSSVDGRFSVALPKGISGFSALTPKSLGDNGSGAMFQWQVREGAILVQYIDHTGPGFSVKSDQDYVNFFAGVREGTVKPLNAEAKQGRFIKLGNFRGYEFFFTNASGMNGIVRTYLVNKRSYTMLGFSMDGSADSLNLIAKVFDTFAVIDPAKVEADIRRSVQAATPASLPQEPAAKKESSDAKDENLKGKVKTVTEESEDLSGTWSVQGRHLSSITDFNEAGNTIKRIGYDSYAKPFQITVYGSIDGAHVSRSSLVRYEYDPPPLTVVSSVAPARRSKSDPRFDSRFAYKYEAGRLVEKQMYSNDGTPGMRYTYKYNGDLVDNLIYGDDQKLNQKYVYRLDEKGNEIESTHFDILGVMGGDEKYKIRYESFDARGNWTKRVTLKLVMENGKESYTPWYISYQTITYYD